MLDLNPIPGLTDLPVGTAVQTPVTIRSSRENLVMLVLYSGVDGATKDGELSFYLSVGASGSVNHVKIPDLTVAIDKAANAYDYTTNPDGPDLIQLKYGYGLVGVTYTPNNLVGSNGTFTIYSGKYLP